MVHPLKMLLCRGVITSTCTYTKFPFGNTTKLAPRKTSKSILKVLIKITMRGNGQSPFERYFPLPRSRKYENEILLYKSSVRKINSTIFTTVLRHKIHLIILSEKLTSQFSPQFPNTNSSHN